MIILGLERNSMLSFTWNAPPSIPELEPIEGREI
jgi:hypothetical protein